MNAVCVCVMNNANNWSVFTYAVFFLDDANVSCCVFFLFPYYIMTSTKANRLMRLKCFNIVITLKLI